MLRTFVGSLLGAAALFSSFGISQANAQPPVDGKAVVCGTFDQYGVTLQSVKWIGDYLIDRKNVSRDLVVTMMQLSITEYCPNYQKAFDDLNSQLEKQQHPGNPLFN